MWLCFNDEINPKIGRGHEPWRQFSGVSHYLNGTPALAEFFISLQFFDSSNIYRETLISVHNLLSHFLF